MKFLVDEQLSEAVAGALQAVGATNDDFFEHIAAVGHGGTEDDDIPALCTERGISALITINVRDFGARKRYYAALLEQRIHVIVGRPKRQQLDAAQQAALFLTHYASIHGFFAKAAGPILLRVTQSAVAVRDLEALLLEVEGGLP